MSIEIACTMTTRLEVLDEGSLYATVLEQMMCRVPHRAPSEVLVSRVLASPEAAVRYLLLQTVRPKFSTGLDPVVDLVVETKAVTSTPTGSTS
ncbi:hypothetical protein [Leucobacter sp. NPDC077196]|uniref:hypothetical protein n=1 Tax=Leucobacter sp. NPDC077196 TaxID=3154959 RepID=UPI0034262C70